MRPLHSSVGIKRGNFLANSCEFWIHFYTLDTKQFSNQWILLGQRAQKKENRHIGSKQSQVSNYWVDLTTYCTQKRFHCEKIVLPTCQDSTSYFRYGTYGKIGRIRLRTYAIATIFSRVCYLSFRLDSKICMMTWFSVLC